MSLRMKTCGEEMARDTFATCERSTCCLCSRWEKHVFSYGVSRRHYVRRGLLNDANIASLEATICGTPRERPM